MAKDNVMLIFTAKSVDEMKRVGGTQSWVLNPVRAKQCEYAILCRNAHSREVWADGRGPHGDAFMVGHISNIVQSKDSEMQDRWLVEFDKFAVVSEPEIWKGWRNPVRYEQVAPFDIDGLKFEDMPEPKVDQAPALPTIDRTRIGLTIDEAKRGLATAFGVSPEAVEITIRG